MISTVVIDEERFAKAENLGITIHAAVDIGILVVLVVLIITIIITLLTLSKQTTDIIGFVYISDISKLIVAIHVCILQLPKTSYKEIICILCLNIIPLVY
jgi:hypothetical protein